MIQLAEHSTIGWDFDGTLIGHPFSSRFIRFISDNPYRQEHHLISFRSHGMELDFKRDLIAEHGPFATLNLFAEIHNLPDELFEAATGRGDPEGAGWEHDPLLEWKGAICNLIGATVLVDDMSAQVLKGCQSYGVLHIHPDEAVFA